MRSLFLVAASMGAALLPAPLLAQESSPEPTSRAADFLSDPDNQAQIAAMADVFGEVMMQMPVGRMAAAVGRMGGENAPDVDPDARLGDLLGAEGDSMRAQMVQRLPMMMTVMAEMSGEMEAMLPQLREAMERVSRRLPAD